jgi:hypothetical protein
MDGWTDGQTDPWMDVHSVTEFIRLHENCTDQTQIENAKTNLHVFNVILRLLLFSCEVRFRKSNSDDPSERVTAEYCPVRDSVQP